MIDLENRKPRKGLGRAIGEGVEPRAQQYILMQPLRDCFGECVLAESAARGDESAKAHAAAIRVRISAFSQLRLGIMADNPERQRIGENRRFVEELVGGAVQGGALGGTARLIIIHRVIFAR
jgi:hypothetical protein